MPKIHFNTDENRWCILDQKDTPFWLAWFTSQEDACQAWRHYQINLLDAQIKALHQAQYRITGQAVEYRAEAQKA